MLPEAECRSCRLARRKSGKSPGSVTMCWTCGEIFLFDEDVEAQVPTARQIAEVLEPQPEWARITRLSNKLKARLIQRRQELAASTLDHVTRRRDGDAGKSEGRAPIVQSV
jgi:hypothetical protein